MTSTQVYRIVTGQPERLNMQFLAALCDIFGCTPADLIEPYVASSSQRGRKTGTAGAAKPPASGSKNRPTRATIHGADRSEEHTSELQSRGHLVCRLLLEKKKSTTAT